MILSSLMSKAIRHIPLLNKCDVEKSLLLLDNSLILLPKGVRDFFIFKVNPI